MVVMTILGRLQVWFTGMDSDGGLGKIMLWGVASLAGGALCVYWGTKTAPSHRKVIGAIITGLVIIIAFVLLIVNIYYSDYGWFWPLISSLAMMFGAGYVMHQIYEEGENFDLFK